MEKTVVLWFAKKLNEPFPSDRIVMMKTLKGLADEIGFPYRTAKSKQPEGVDQKRLWVVGDDAYEVWFEEKKNFR